MGPRDENVRLARSLWARPLLWPPSPEGHAQWSTFVSKAPVRPEARATLADCIATVFGARKDQHVALALTGVPQAASPGAPHELGLHPVENTGSRLAHLFAASPAVLGQAPNVCLRVTDGDQRVLVVRLT